MSKKEILFEAISYAAEAHRGRFRRGGNIPEIVHPMGVGRDLLERGFSVDLAVAGFLHDTLEDTKIKKEDIRKRFGERVLKIVPGVTEPGHRTKPWKKRKKHTIEYLKSAPENVVIVSCTDKLDNIRSLVRDHQKVGEKLWKRFNAPREDQKWYYQSLAKVFEARAKDIKSNKILEEFIREVASFFGS